MQPEIKCMYKSVAQTDNVYQIFWSILIVGKDEYEAQRLEDKF